jgi:ABC-type oligopeptide transport system substrate-binding subunit
MMKFYKIISLVIVFTMALGAFAGCAPAAPAVEAPAAEAPAAVAPAAPEATAEVATAETTTDGKHVLNIAKLIELQATDQHRINDGMSNELVTALLDGLYTLTADGEVDPLMAESYTVSEDGLVYTFTIRDAFWSNGDPVTANDFVFSWRRLVDPKTAAPNRNEAAAAGIKNAAAIVKGELAPEELGVTAIDDKTLQVEIVAPVPYFLATLIRPAFLPLNEAFFKKSGVKYGMNPAFMISNGPFLWTYWDYATNISVEKNPTYWNAENIDIDEINWKIVKDSQTASLMFENGELDWAEIAGSLIDQYADDPRFTKALEVHMWWLVPNFTNEALQNLNIRKALATSFDKEAVAGQVMNNGAQAADYIVGYKLAFGPDGKQMRETTGTYLSYDVAGAQAAWTAGLEELGTDAITLNYLYWDDDVSVGMAEFIASEWEKNLPGLTVELTSMPKGSANTESIAGNFDIYQFRWGPDYKDPMAFLELLGSDASYNRGKFQNDEYDSIITGARTPEMLNDLETRWDSLKRAEQILLEEQVGVFPVVQNGLGMLINPKVHGLEVRNTGLTWNYRFVTMED